jgi:D-glycero-alpha-D-manno-heptose-7-phosphate kinase
MIISRTPFRVSLFGGGTDYPTWFNQHGGAVLGMAINKYCYISVRYLPPFFEHKHRIVYSKVENVRSLDEIEHPAVRAVLKDINVDRGLEIHHDGDLPARSGLGSSSSFVVGLLHSLRALDNKMSSQAELAKKATYIEQEALKESVGNQDQIWAAFGGFKRIDFLPDGSYRQYPMMLSRKREQELNRSLMLFFTGITRFATDIAAKKIANLHERSGHLIRMTEMVDEAQEIINNPGRAMREIGELLHESWLLKRDITDGISTDKINEIYDAGCEAGAVGGKLLGAGGGGFMLFYVEPENQAKVRSRLSDLIEVSFNMDKEGSKIVIYEPGV